MKTIVRSLAVMPAQYRVAFLIVFFGAFTLASSFGQCPAPFTLSANTSSQHATPGTWTAPATGGPYLIQITAAGGAGGGQFNSAITGGKGAVMTGSFIVNAGQELDITSGAAGFYSSPSQSSSGAGGGGSGVYDDVTKNILIIAGGGGGYCVNIKGGDGQITINGQGPLNQSGNVMGSGGTNGNGGPTFGGGGGGGYLTNGQSSPQNGGGFGGGVGFNGTGGAATSTDISAAVGGGGVGGGGGIIRTSDAQNDLIIAGGGGGGYSGGSGGQTSNTISPTGYAGGGGGGSINSGTNQTNTAGANAGGGYVTITCLGPACPSGNILYVNAGATGSNTGTSWNDAFNKLQDALALTNTCSGINQIWVAKGTYYPDEGVGQTDNNLNSTFTLKNGVAIYGGFAGTETVLSDRNPRTNVTILNGDIDKDNILNATNASHVVTGSGTNNTAVLDGFSINKGYGANGAGMYNVTGSPTVNNCIFSGNYFTSSGGGMYNYAGASPIVTNCIFQGNTGKIISSPPFSLGAGMSNQINSNPIITNCIFSGNNCFVGGAMYNNNLSSPVITNCTFSGNAASSTAGGLYNDNAPVTITNCICYNNRDNSGTGSASSGIVQASNTNNITYSLIQGQNPPGTGNLDGTNAANDPKFVSSLDPATAPGTDGNFHLQPGSPAIDKGTNTGAPTTDIEGNTRPLTATNPADIGAYESPAICPSSNIVYVNAGATGSNNGTSWTNAFTKLQDALALTNTCSGINQVWVATGTYYPDEGVGQTDNNLNSTFALKNGVAIYGGFAGTETLLSQRNWKTNVAILSGDIDNDHTIANNAYHVTTGSAANNTAILDGFTITGGNAICVGGCNTGGQFGGGMYNNIGSPRVSNCIFSGNIAAEFGAGMYNVTSSPIVTNCSFIDNSYSLVVAEPNVGGGMYNQASSPTVVNCIFSGNSAFTAGAGIYNNLSSSPSITNCTFSGNSVNTFNGGAICTGSGNPVLLNCVFWNNRDVSGTGTASSSVFGPASVNYSLIQGQNPPGTGNLDGTDAANDPRFVTPIDPATAPTISGDFHLQCSSPAINAGTNTGAPATDIEGSSRALTLADPADMGAYEKQGSCNQPTTTTITSSLNPSCFGSNVIFTATVLINGNAAAPVTTGTVTFKEGTTVLADNVALDANGQGSFSTGALGASSHLIIATYNAAPGFNTSNTSINQVVNARPTASISGGGTYCSGSPATTNLLINVTGSGIISGTLSDNSSFSGTAPSINVSVSPSATTTYTIATLQDANNCSAQSADLSGSATVTINPAATATISGTNAVCQDASSPGITFNGSGGTAPYTFAYSINDAVQPAISDDGSGTITIYAPTTNFGSYVYKLLNVQDNSASACLQTITGQSATITVNALPSATIGGTITVCQNSSEPSVTFNGSGGTGPYTFTYSLSNSSTTTAGLTVTGDPGTVPASTTNAGIYTYTLTGIQDVHNCPQSLSPQFVQVTVNALPNANISTASMVTAGSTGNIASVDNAGTGTVYSWTITNGIITNGTGTNSITYTAGLSGSVSLSVSVTGAGNCGPVSGGPVVVPITALPCPNPAISTSWLVCASSNGNVATAAKVNGNKYVWTVTNGTITTGAGTNSIAYKAGSFGAVILSVTVTNASGQCSVSSGKYFVLISPLPIAAIAAPTSVCASSTGNIVYVPGCGLAATYAWTITNGTITSGNNTSKIIFTAAASGSVTLSVTVTNGAGCKSSSGSKVVTIVPYPVASITAASSVCSGSSNNTASVANGGSGAKYAWGIINGCITSGSSTNSITYTATKSGTITLKVTVTNSSGCKASSANKTVTIVAAPTAVITSAPSLCAGSTNNTASVSSAGSGAAYAWTISGGTITSGSGTSSIKYTAVTSGFVTLTATVTSSGGCKASCSKKVTIVAVPAANITASSSVCGSSTGNIASVSSAGTGATYAWSITNGTITSGGTTSSIKYTAGPSGTVGLSVTITNSTGCKATVSKNITVAATVPAFLQTGPLCKNAKAPSLPAKSNNGITGSWSPSKISTSSLTTTTYTFTPAAGQCASTTTMKITVKNCSALSDANIVSSQQAISKDIPVLDAALLPNPSENFFTLIIKGNRKEVAEIRVMDVLGHTLNYFKAGTGSPVQFGGNYVHGTYIVQVLQGTDRKVLKAIKQ